MAFKTIKNVIQYNSITTNIIRVTDTDYLSFTIAHILRYADLISVGDEVLVQETTQLSPGKVINVTELPTQGDNVCSLFFTVTFCFYFYLCYYCNFLVTLLTCYFIMKIWYIRHDMFF